MPLSARTQTNLKRASICVSVVVGMVDLVILSYFVASFVYLTFLKEHTLYSPRYSEEIFAQVKTGMTEAEVIALLGVPLKIVESSGGRIKRVVTSRNGTVSESYPDLPPGNLEETTEVAFFYSQPGSATSDWHIRCTVLNSQRIVSRVLKEYYVD